MATGTDSIPYTSHGSQQTDSGFSKSSTGAYSLSPMEDPELVEPADRYMCPLHLGILKNPVQTSCGHRLCKECLEKYLDGKVSKPCPVVDEEVQEEVSLANIYPDPGFQREIKQLSVYCYYKGKGCKEIIKYREYEQHKGECRYRPAECIYKLNGCKEDVALIDLENHLKKCDYKPCSCQLCGQQFNAKDIKDHEVNHCPEGYIQCPFKCGIKKFKRRGLDDHKAVCPLKPTECRYKAVGCDFTGDKSAVENHEKNVSKHFDIMATLSCGLQAKLEDHIQEVKQRLTPLEEKVKKLERELMIKLVNYTENRMQSEKKTEDIERKLHDLAEIQAAHDSQLKSLRKDIGQSRDTREPSFDSPEVSQLKIRLAEMDLRFQMIETANYDGTLLWKIRDFSIRRRDAVQGRTVSLYSQPFYSSRFGYKMCARVYLNGDGIGKGTHLSLYFVVMKGEYDALLAWPFGLKITLMLLDQSTSKRHLKDEFMPDPNSTSFHRPNVADMNVASGCPLFVAHAVLDESRNQYIKDDMLFIKVTVDCSQLPKI